MPISTRCSGDFDYEVKARGQVYYLQGRVRLGSPEDTLIRAEVKGTSGDYGVSVDWCDARRGILETWCTCTYFDDRGPCKHLWATLLAMDASGIGPPRGNVTLEIYGNEYLAAESDDGGDDDSDDEDDGDDWDDDEDEYADDDENEDEDADDVLDVAFRIPGRLGPAGNGSGRSAGKPRVLDWHKQLAPVLRQTPPSGLVDGPLSPLSKVREAWYVLDAEKITYEYLDGRTRDRGARVERFQTDAACPLFLISLKAGGHGLNLTAADYVFILDPWWNPAVEARAVDRAHRIGQTRRVFAYRLIARDTVEEKIVELQKSKRDLAEAIVSADQNLLRSLTAEDLAVLLS